MNILVLGQGICDGRGLRGPTREQRFAQHLARDHRVTLAFVTDDQDCGARIGALRDSIGDVEFAVLPRGWQALAAAARLLAGESCTLAYRRSEALRLRLQHRVATTAYDLVFVTAAGMIPYALELPVAIPVVVDFGEVESEHWLRTARRIAFPWKAFCQTEGLRLRLAEAAIARRASRCLVSSAQASEVLETFAPWAPSHVVPDAVPLESFATTPRASSAPALVWVSPITEERDVDALRTFCEQVFAVVRERVPEAQLVVPVTAPLASARRVGELAGVIVAAPVDDVRPFLQRSLVAVAPLDAGIRPQREILHAMASGLPVVTTTSGAVGLGAEAGRELHVEDRPSAFASRLLELLQGPAQRREMATRAASFLTDRYSWSAVVAQLEPLLGLTGPVPPSPLAAERTAG
jgi:glycosyltransferase involved in cell wall biosynthesis